MSAKNKEPKSYLSTIKAPLIFSLVLALVAFSVVSITSAGGSADGWRIDLGLIAFGVTFAASLVLVSMMSMAAKDNPSSISEGAGINRRSEDVFRRQQAERARKEAEERAANRAKKDEEDGKSA
ncbi:hypothetical protein [Micrococcoides hystricis]|uniref:Amino acid transporter n=1 Tax=Micrococcoides hystricis TaxID=1572761 RepID=A0ABV6PBP2_9MICC